MVEWMVERMASDSVGMKESCRVVLSAEWTEFYLVDMMVYYLVVLRVGWWVFEMVDRMVDY